MANLTIPTQNPTAIDAYELLLKKQLRLIENIRASQSRLIQLPTNEYYNIFGSTNELENDLRLEREVLSGFKAQLMELSRKELRSC